MGGHCCNLSDAQRIPAVQRALRSTGPPLLHSQQIPPQESNKSTPEASPVPVRRRRQRRVFDMSTDVTAALTAMFNIDDDNDAADIDHALAGLVDDGIAELQEGVVERQMEVGGLQTGAGALHAAA
ncbi:hypothetical protein C2845_PM06G04810 [Panicum miliaceum]|uniref:Uncharacterized protein n=1 Tax=Panicum miliaceum TaxID=4540 RepID=A0A3L6R8V0_PANMI|nr:hypothetical protein C2845_PM06G04810 [Panicum miliaceum]